MSYKVLFVDDDRHFTRIYQEKLRPVFNVVMCYDATSAIKHLNEDPEIMAAIVDVQLPPPRGRDVECQNGNTTGVWILEQCQDAIQRRRIGLLIFTNRAGTAKEEIKDLAFDSRITEVCSKSSIRAEDLPGKVMDLIEKR